MIKICPISLDLNTPNPMGAVLFVKYLCTYDDRFEIASSIESCDCALFSQFSQNYVLPEIFDKEKADYLVHLKKPIIMYNDGGGILKIWKQSPIGEYIWGGFSELIKVFFSVECYSWHRKEMPNFLYAPFDFIGYYDSGLGLREVRSKEQFLNRTFGTCCVQNTYPPTRDKLWEIVTDPDLEWESFNHHTHPDLGTDGGPRIKRSEYCDKMSNSKIGFAPDGATSKTERQIFVPLFTAMMMQDDSVEFPFEWEDGVKGTKRIQ